MLPRTLRWFLPALLALTQTAFGQTTVLKGGVSNDDNPSPVQIYAGQDPTKGVPESMPPAGSGKCDPPMAGWILVYQTPQLCYYFAPFKTPLQAKVVTPQEAAKYQWERCGAHPWDPNLLLCFGTPKPKPEPAGSAARAVDPCHPGINLSKLSPAMAAQVNAQTKQECDAFRCSHNPELDVCKTVVTQKPPEAPPADPLTNTIDYARGLVDGLGDCIKSFGNLQAGAAFFLAGDFVNSARVLGLSPGQSITLRTIASELSQKMVGRTVSAHDQGQIAGRRICSYALIPGLTKAGASVLRAGTPGASVLNPLKGQALINQVSENPAGLVNQFVETAKGPVQLGAFVGKGTFGGVFKLPAGRVIKIQTNHADSAASFPRQEAGSKILRKIGVDTPEIHQIDEAGPNQAAIIIMDDVTKFGFRPIKWPELGAMPQAQFNQVIEAVTEVNNKIANSGHVWADGHLNNMMFKANRSGGLTAIVHDADMIMTVPEVQGAISTLSTPGKVILNVLQRTGLTDILSQPYTAQSLTAVLQKAYFGGAGQGGSTVH